MGQLAAHLGQVLGCPNYLVDAHATLCTLANWNVVPPISMILVNGAYCDENVCDK